MAKPRFEKHEQYKQLLRLQNLRSQRCEAEYRKAREVLTEAQNKQKERELTISEHRSGLASVKAAYRAGAEAGADVNRHFLRHREYWLNYDLEREQYYLQMEMDEAKEAEQKLTQAWNAWSRARNKSKTSQERVSSCIADKRQREEARMESEIEDIFTQDGRV